LGLQVAVETVLK